MDDSTRASDRGSPKQAPQAEMGPAAGAWWVQRLALDRWLAWAHAFAIPPTRPAWLRYLGGLGVMLACVQAVTGVLLMVAYRPGASAHESVQHISSAMAFGWLVRGTHAAAAHALAAIVIVHGAAALFREAHRAPRELVWLSGCCLFLVVGAFQYTGAVLPADRRAILAATVGASAVRDLPLAGPWLAALLAPSAAGDLDTIQRLYGLHVGNLPAAGMLLVGVHLLLIHAHGLAPQGKSAGKNTDSFADFLKREAALWVLAIAALVTIAALVPVRLGPAAASAVERSADIRPAWCFMPLFAIMRIASHPWAALLALFAAFAPIALAPLWAQRSAFARKATRLWLAAVLAGATILALWGYAAP